MSPALSLFARPGDGSIRTRRVAILVADGCDGAPLAALADRLTAEGAVPRFVSTTLGAVETSGRRAIEVDVSLEAAPAVLYDALVLPDGDEAVAHCARTGGRSNSSRTSTATASRSSRWAPALSCSRRAGSRRAARRPARSGPDHRGGRERRRSSTPSSRRSPSIGTSREKPIRRACEARASAPHHTRRDDHG